MGSNEETNAAGTDTRPPMLVESDYDSWKIRIHSLWSSKTHLQQPKSTSTAKEIWIMWIAYARISRTRSNTGGNLLLSSTDPTHPDEHSLKQPSGLLGLLIFVKWVSKRQFPPTNNQRLNFLQLKDSATVHEWSHVTRTSSEKAPDTDYNKIFKPIHEIASDSDVDEGPNALSHGDDQEEPKKNLNYDAETEIDDNYDPYTSESS
ncbi:hypothetical protein Tco_0471318 [Tanacetum coccineum]